MNKYQKPIERLGCCYSVIKRLKSLLTSVSLMLVFVLTGTLNGIAVELNSAENFQSGNRGNEVVYESEMLLSANAEAQNFTVNGTVTDANGTSLPGVSIVLKGTSNGTITDIDGKFMVANVPSNGVLEFSFIGMKTVSVEVKDGSNLLVVMEESNIGLDEVVAIGYGVVKKSDLTGAVASVSSKSFENQPVENAMNAIQGLAAGVVISNMSGAPGGQTRIRIRGANSITGGNDPLYVVDGMQLNNFKLNDLNPSDIENIEILKDASATAIYGSRGANGVVLITTKKGKAGKPVVNIKANYGMSERATKYDLLDPVAYAEQVNQTFKNGYSEEYIGMLQNGGGTDWQDAIFQQGNTRDLQVSVSGTAPSVSYLVSGRYFGQKGIIINSDFEKYSFHSKTVSELSDKVKLSTSIFLNHSEGFNNQTAGSLRGGAEQALIWGPAEPIYDEDGSYHMGDKFGALGPNPVANLEHEHQDNINTSAMLNGQLQYDITDYLKLEIVAGVDMSNYENSSITSPYAPYGIIGASRNVGKAMYFQNSNILTFHKEFNGVHDLTVTGVVEQSKGHWDNTTASGTGSPFTEGLLYYDLSVQDTKDIGSSYGMSGLLSYVGRVNYTYSNKYLVTASYRADGSSKFPNNKWGYFPSFGLGWRLNEEEFMKNLNVFSNLKLRGGYGVTGNQGVGAFSTIPNMVFDTFAYGFDSGIIADISNSVGDPDLRWEQTAQTDIGLDMGFFENHLTLSVDYFNKQTKDLLLRVPIPLYGGGGSKLSNVGSVENAGYEFVIGAVPFDKGDFSWDFNFNMSFYKNKVVDLGDADFIVSTIGNLVGSGMVTNDFLRNIEGEPMATFWGAKFLGIWQEEEADEAKLYKNKPGDSKYLDLNGDYTIDGLDNMMLGSATPKGSWGFNNTITYKDFEFNLFVYSMYGQKIFNMDYALAATRFGDSKTVTSAVPESWTPENRNNTWPSLTSSSNKEILASSKWVQDGSFIRVKNISLMYTLPKSILNKSVKIGVSGQNLYTFTHFIGYDPEAQSAGSNDINQGVISGSYPSPRVITFSLKVDL